MKISLFFAWFDCWIGWFYDKQKKILYICPLPMVVIKIQKTKPRKRCENCRHLSRPYRPICGIDRKPHYDYETDTCKRWEA
jgi:hypothetical protein